MPFYQAGSIKYFRFACLDRPGVNHAIFTRQGGVSPAPWESLNMGASVGDEYERVRQNREMALNALDLGSLNTYDVYQVHSTEIVLTDRPLAVKEAHIKADGIITRRSRLTLMMRFADCVPIFLFDPAQKAIGIVHAGWQGTINKIIAKAVSRMEQDFGSRPIDIIAAIGPSIGPDHYEVGSDVIEKAKASFNDRADQLIMNRSGKSYLDLWKANELILNEVGVRQVEIAGICTQCHLEDWYSHRGEYGKTGRFGAVISLA